MTSGTWRPRTCSGPYCKAYGCSNGRACGSTMPGPGSKGTGTVAVRNYEAWQSLCLLDTICENKPVDTRFSFFGETYQLPSLPALWARWNLHYGDEFDMEYNNILVPLCGCRHCRLHWRRHQPGCVHRRRCRHRRRRGPGHPHGEALGPGYPVRQAGQRQGLRGQGVRHGHRRRRPALPQGADTSRRLQDGAGAAGDHRGLYPSSPSSSKAS